MSIVAFSIAALVAIPTLIFIVQCLAAMGATWFTTKKTTPSTAANDAEYTAAIIIPAHNEQQVITATIRSLLPQMGASGRVVAIAHNCDDETAQVARDAGAEVLELNEPDRRGKGWALAAGRDFLRSNPPDAMVVVDADTVVEPDFLKPIVTMAMQRNSPAQSKYVLHVDSDDADAADYVSSLAFTVRNAVRPLGMKLLGLPCMLTGSGFALPWSLAADAPLAGGHAGEDYKLGIDLTLKGNRPYFCPDAVVRGPLPRTKQVATVQRRRWSHSQLAFMRNELPRLLGDFLLHARLASFGLICDLVVPPLILLMLLQWLAIAATGIIYLAGGSHIPLLITVATCASFLAVLLAVAAVFEKKLLNRKVLLALPRYFFRYLPQYLAFFHKADTQWTKTPRESSAP